MKTTSIHSSNLLSLFKNKRIATKDEILNELGTSSRATMFRKLSELNYISSYSHGGKYYSLVRTARFNKSGLWFPGSACFSRSGTLLETITDFVDDSENGCSAAELDNILRVKVANPLLNLFDRNLLNRGKWGGVYIYYSAHPDLRKKQELNRKESLDRYTPLKEPAMLMNELKASLVTFFSLLDEQQRRVFLGLESLKHGHGGDRLIAEIFGTTEKTVAKGRKELIEDRVLYDSIRGKGGGRTPLEKKRRASKDD